MATRPGAAPAAGGAANAKRRALRLGAAALFGLGLAAAGVVSGEKPQQRTTLVKEGRYRIHIESAPPSGAGDTGEVRVRVESTAPWHVSTEAPVSLTLEAPPGVTFEPAVLGRGDAATLNDDVLEFRTAYRCDTSETNASGRLKLGICQGDLCVIVREELDIPVRAH
jgi:hypothetical protein